VPQLYLCGKEAKQRMSTSAELVGQQAWLTVLAGRHEAVLAWPSLHLRPVRSSAGDKFAAESLERGSKGD
jgi:hypothetical protein